MLDFQPIELSMKPLIEKYRAYWNMDSSEYTFTNLFIWGAGGHISIAEYADTLFCLLRWGPGAPFMFAPLPLNGSVDYGRAVAIAREYFQKRGIPIKFSAVSEPLADLFRVQCPEYELTEDRANFDYVYRTEDLLHLNGKKYHAKRNHYNHFLSQHEFEYVTLTSDMVEECLQVYTDWLEDKQAIEPSAFAEMEAIRLIVSHMDVLGVHGGGIRINDRLAAFTLGEKMREDTALIHIEKADGSVRGLFTAINKLFIEHEWQDTLYINREEDMGLEGLRKAKLSYHPVRMVEKFEARLK